MPFIRKWYLKVLKLRAYVFALPYLNKIPDQHLIFSVYLVISNGFLFLLDFYFGSLNLKLQLWVLLIHVVQVGGFSRNLLQSLSVLLVISTKSKPNEITLSGRLL